MLNRTRTGLIHVAKRALKLADDDYRAILRRVAGVGSARELDELGFHDVMAEFERLGFRSTWRKQTGGHRAGMATPSQVRFMVRLWCDYRGEDDEAGFRAWLERFYRVSDARFVTADAANGVITALKIMARRKRAG